MVTLTTLFNFEFFSGHIERIHTKLQDSDDFSDLPTRVIRVIAESEDAINQSRVCAGLCDCRQPINMQEQRFYVDFLSYPSLKIYCSIACAKRGVKKNPFQSISGGWINYDTQIEPYDVVQRIPTAIPNASEQMH